MAIELCGCGGRRFGCLKCDGSGFRHLNSGENFKFTSPLTYNPFLGNGDEKQEYILEARVFGYEDKPLSPVIRVKRKSSPARRFSFFRFRSQRTEKVMMWHGESPLPELQFPGRRRSIGNIDIIYVRKRNLSVSMPMVSPSVRLASLSVTVKNKTAGLETLGSLVTFKKTPTVYQSVWARR